MNLDDRLRSRIAELADADGDLLEENSRQRVVANAAANAPRLIRRAQIVHTGVRVGSAALVSIGAAFWFWPRVEVAPVAPVIAQKACETWGALDGLSLGPRGRLQLAAETSLRVIDPGPCSIVLGLERGRVTVFADDLGSGSLVIVAGEDRVSVRGTVFSVEREEEKLVVEVREGTVELREKSGAVQLLSAGRNFVRQAPRVEAPVETPRVEARRSAEKPSKIAPAPEIDPESLVAEADVLARDGQLERARGLYTRAGAMRGPTAEAAWIALAKLELRSGRAAEARAALNKRRDLFKSGALALEAAWLSVKVERQAGREEEARRLARDLIESWPESAQAAEARRWLE